MRKLVIIMMSLLASVSLADEQVSGVIVSVYRPLEMEARRVKVARKVFIQSNDDTVFSNRLVGQILTVYRQHTVPAQVVVTPTSMAAGSSDSGVENSASNPSQSSDFQDANLKTLQPLRSGRPAGFAEPRHDQPVQMPIYLGNGNGTAGSVSPIREAVVPGARIREKVGQIRVLSVDGDVAIAEVLEDGLRLKKAKAPEVKPVEGTTVSAGDLAQGVIKKIVVKPKALPLSSAEKTALKKERDRIRKLSKPKKKRGKYRRKVMQYDL
jgi:hypothetical protein